MTLPTDVAARRCGLSASQFRKKAKALGVRPVVVFGRNEWREEDLAALRRERRVRAGKAGGA